jgi:hypothetical protein
VALGGGFEEAITRRGGVSKLRSLAARRYPDVVVGVALGDPAQEEQPEWEYEIAFTQDNRQRPIIKREMVKNRGQKILLRPNLEDTSDVARLQIVGASPNSGSADTWRKPRPRSAQLMLGRGESK